MLKNFIRMLLGPLLLGGVLSGCTNIETPLISSSEPQARIRIYRGTTARLYLGDVCDDSNPLTIHTERWGFPFLMHSTSIGMPLTDDMPFSYDEYTIPAGQRVTVKMYWQA